MNQFAEQGLISDVSDVWPIDGISDSFKEASTASDGKQYFVPKDYYPWAVFYKKSVFEKRGYAPPATFDEFDDADEEDAVRRPRAVRLRGQGRLAGDGHLRHPQHADQRLRLPHEPDGRRGGLGQHRGQAGLRHLARTAALPPGGPARAGPGRRPPPRWATSECGMYLLGTFVVDAIPDLEDDLDFFTFPELDASIGATALDAPIDGFCLAAGGDNQEGGKEMLKFLGTAEAADAANADTTPFIAANSNAEHQRLLRAAEEVGRGRRRGDRHRPVPRPRHPLRLRLDGDDPVAPEVPGGPRRHRRRHREHPGAEGVDLRRLTILGSYAQAHLEEAQTRRGDTNSGRRDATPAGLRPAGGSAAGPARGHPRWSSCRPCSSSAWCGCPAVLSVILSFGTWNGIGDIDTIEWVGHPELLRHRQHLPAVLAGDPAQPDLARCSSSWARRCSGCCWRWCSTATCAAAASTRRRSTCRSCCRWRWSASSGSSSTPATRACSTRCFNTEIDWYGDSDINLWAVLVATAWRHTGYIMLIYLAGLKGVDASLREAAAVDGATERQTFFQIVFPVMRPINMIVRRHRRDRVAARLRPGLGRSTAAPTASS